MKLNCANLTISVVALLLFVVQSISAQTAATSPTSELISARIDEYMNAAVNAEHFSGSILVAKGNRPIINKGYGMANYELDVPNTPNTIFQIASLTKGFTAAAIMQLQEKGSDDVREQSRRRRISDDGYVCKARGALAMHSDTLIKRFKAIAKKGANKAA